jgi:hypothetical protein
MSSHYSYFCPNYVTYRESVINETSPICNDRFDLKNRSTQKNKCKVIKQVYRVKKDGRLNKNSDLTLDIENHILKNHQLVLLTELSPMINMSQII